MNQNRKKLSDELFLKLKSLEIESVSRKIPIIGEEKGNFLFDKILEYKPLKVLELGTANGYSGIILGSRGAKIYTIDINRKIQFEAKKNYDDFEINYNMINGDGVEEVKKFEDDFFDFVFIDFAKKKYIDVIVDAIRVTKKGGVIIADNITMDGCSDFVEFIKTDKRLKTELIDIKDGLSFSILLE